MIPSTVAPGTFALQASATSGSISHAAQLSLTVTPAPDFNVAVNPSSIGASAGSTTGSFNVSVTGQNGFSGSPSITFSGLPSGSSITPAGPVSIAAGSSQAFQVTLPADADVGITNIQVNASNGSVIRSVPLILSINAQVQTYDTGTMLYLESRNGADVSKIGLRKAWGGSIVEVSLNGTNFVNSDDPGRQLQTSLWDGNATYGGSWGYNPIEAGDEVFDGSPLLDFTLNPDSIYTKTQPIQWDPYNFGGSIGNPVLGDAYIEKWISVVPGTNRAFQVHYKITHFGTDAHANASQELPVLYVNPQFSTFWYYGGNSPWTNGSLTSMSMPYSCCINLYTPELWGAYTDASGSGITLYTPDQFPSSKGFSAGSTNQFTPLSPFNWDPGIELEFDTFAMAGPVVDSRALVYRLHQQLPTAKPLPPYGFLGPPNNGDVISGTYFVNGWVWPRSDIQSVDVFVDGNYVGSATHNLFMDVTSVYPGAPQDVGYQYSLDTTKLANGSHTVTVKATDANGRVSTFATKQVTVTN